MISKRALKRYIDNRIRKAFCDEYLGFDDPEIFPNTRSVKLEISYLRKAAQYAQEQHDKYFNFVRRTGRGEARDKALRIAIGLDKCIYYLNFMIKYYMTRPDLPAAMNVKYDIDKAIGALTSENVPQEIIRNIRGFIIRARALA